MKKYGETPPDYEPSQAMLDEVGLYFDGDLAEMQKGSKRKRPRLSALWLLLIAFCLLVLFWIDPSYGFLFIAGAALSAVGGLIWFSAIIRKGK